MIGAGMVIGQTRQPEPDAQLQPIVAFFPAGIDTRLSGGLDKVPGTNQIMGKVGAPAARWFTPW